MEGKDWAILIAAVFGGLTSLVAAVFAGLASLRAAEAKAQGKVNELSIQDVKRTTDGMKDALVQAAGDKGFRAGAAGESNPTVQVDPKAVAILKKLDHLEEVVPEKTAEKVVEKIKDA